MTKEQKKANRALRHQVYKTAKRLAVQRIGLFSTGGQIGAAAKILTDRGKAAMREVSVESPMTSYVEERNVAQVVSEERSGEL